MVLREPSEIAKIIVGEASKTNSSGINDNGNSNGNNKINIKNRTKERFLIAFYQSGLYQSVTVNQIVFQSSILSVTQRVILICWNSSSLSKLKSVLVRVLI